MSGRRIGTPAPAREGQSPAALGYRMPAEWEPHAATILGWPHERRDWPGKLAPIPWVYGEVVRHLTPGERVRIMVGDAATARRAKLLLSRVRVLAFGDAQPAGGGPNTHDVHARTVVLAVPTEEVDRLALADSAGHLLLALRNPHDIEGGQRSSSAVLARVGGSAARAVRPSTVADAGVSLGALAGSDGGVEATAAVRPPTMRRAMSGAGRVEVVRAGHVDSPGS